MARPCSTVALALLLPQDPLPSPVELAEVPGLGALPRGAPVLTVDAAGAVSFAGSPWESGPLPGDAALAVLRVAADAPSGAVGRCIEALAESGVRSVAFAARGLREGSEGAITLEIAAPAARRRPEGRDDAVLRLHRQRRGVPVESVRLPLERWARGPRRLDGEPQLFVVVPRDAAFRDVMRLLSSIAAAGVEAVQVRWDGAAAGAGGVHAIDLELPMPVPVSARAVAVTSREPREGELGLTVPGVEVAAERRMPGGMFGGRSGRPRPNLAQPLDAALEVLAGHPWPPLDRSTDADLEREAQAALAFLGAGRDPLGRDGSVLGVLLGRLLARQDDAGRIGAGDVRAHARATHALAEAWLFGAVGVYGSLQDALAWLAMARGADGGWPARPGGTPSEMVPTVTALLALETARYADVEASVHPGDVVPWIEAQIDEGGWALPRVGADPEDVSDAARVEATAGALWALFLTQEWVDARMSAMADQIRGEQERVDQFGDIAREWAALTMYQQGGIHWKGWSRQLLTEQAAAVDTDVDAAIARALLGLTFTRYTRLIR